MNRNQNKAAAFLCISERHRAAKVVTYSGVCVTDNTGTNSHYLKLMTVQIISGNRLMTL